MVSLKMFELLNLSQALALDPGPGQVRFIYIGLDWSPSLGPKFDPRPIQIDLGEFN